MEIQTNPPKIESKKGVGPTETRNDMEEGLPASLLE